MNISRRTTIIYAAASATQTLPEPAIMVSRVTLITGSATWAAPTKYTVVTGTPAAEQVQFTGTPQAPSSTLTFSAALTAGDLLLVEYVRAGAICAAA